VRSACSSRLRGAARAYAPPWCARRVAHRAAQGATRRRPRELAEHLERIGFERVPMVEDVAQFSLRGGILDVYSFG
jgi:transcription-repair coupling factor (superfamily II helicase)